MKPDSPQEPSVRTTPFERVVSLCEEFTGEHQAAAAVPSIDSYLERVAADAQPSLFRNLLAIDVKHRRAAGEQPRLEQYLERFPRFASLIRDVFLDLSSVSSVAARETPRPRVAAARLPVDRLGEYRLLGELGRGGMGVVYEALHVRRGDRVALKTLPTLDGDALHRFKREFRALADVNHPNLIGLHTLEADGCHWFFTMDLIAGVNFLAFVRPEGRLDEARLRQALAQLASAVMALHARHVIHRDLKPANVLVTHDGRVVVLDFGLVLEQDRGTLSQSTQNAAGTPKYMAPEQAAGSQVSAASDWYAVGVMLYEALGGQAPFSGSVLQVLQDKQRLDPPALPAEPTIPEDLAELSMRLLAREPRLRPDALAIAGAVSAGGTPAPAAGGAHAGPRLVGREQHMAALMDAFGTLQRRREPLTVFVSGRSGEGKTTLAEHFLTPLREDRRLAVMSGRCYDRESVPFKALDSLIDALASYLRSLPETDAALVIPDDVGMLVQVFPVLQRVEVVARIAPARLAGLDEQQVRQRAFRALRSLLSRVSRRSQVVWFVDDLQWGDADSAEALFEVLRPPEAPAVLFLGAYRSDETEGSAFLKAWKELQRKHGVACADREVKVGPLSVEECAELVVGLLGKDSDAIRRRAAEFAQETKGNPFFLVELVGCFDPDTDSFERVPLHEVLRRKLGRLPAEAGPLLEVVAVSGQALALAEASRTAGHALPPTATLIHMRNERLLRLMGTEENPLVDTYHDRIRETVLGRLDEDRGKTLHRTLAEVLEQDMGVVRADLAAALESGQKQDEAKAIPRVYDLAYHFDAAGEKRKAWSYALLAAEQARRQFSLDVAANQYAVARRNSETTSQAVRYRIAEGSGEALMLLGRYDEAATQLDSAIELADAPQSKARIEALRGEVAFKQGAMDKSVATYEQGLRRLGNWVPSTFLGLGYGILRESLVQCWHSLFPKWLHRRPDSSEQDLAVRLYNRLMFAYGFRSTPHAAWASLSGMNRAELLPASPRLAFSYAMHASMMAMLGWHTRGARYGDRATALARQFDDLWGCAHSCNYEGIGCFASARYEQGLARLTEALGVFDKAGDLWEVNMAHFHVGCCHFGLGDLAQAVAQAKTAFASSARLGDSRVLCSSWLWARATRGNVPFEELKSCYPSRPDDVLSSVHGVMAEGQWHTFHGRTEEALHVFESAAALIRKSRCVNFHTIVVLPVLAGALRLHAEAVRPRDAQQGEQLLRRAYRVAKWATRIARFFPGAYPHALRERSLVLEAYGKTKEALKLADSSCAVAEKQKAKYEYAQSLLVRGRLAKQLALPEADEQIRTAEAAIEACEQPVREAASRQTVSLVEVKNPGSIP